MIPFWSAKSLLMCKQAVNQLVAQKTQVHEQLSIAKDARAAAMAHLAEELGELEGLHQTARNI